MDPHCAVELGPPRVRFWSDLKIVMWGCVALLVVVGIVALATNAYVLLFVIPCMLMMCAMVWMMMGGSSRGTRRDQRP
jgi:ABC-type siderophore export system fused ATPase/permease subunit